MADGEDSAEERGHSDRGLTRSAYLWTVTASGAIAIAWSMLEVVARPPGALAAVLAALTVVSAAATVRLTGFPVSFSLSDTFTIAAALLFGPAAGALLVALDGLVSRGA